MFVCDFELINVFLITFLINISFQAAKEYTTRKNMELDSDYFRETCVKHKYLGI